MNFKNFILTALFVAIAVSFFIFRNLRQSNHSTLPKLVDLNGREFNPEVLNDKLYIVSYFQTWCSDCLEEKPQLEALIDKYGEENIQVVLVSDEPIEKLSAYREKFKTQLPIYHSEKALKDDLGIRAFPTTFLFDKNGKLIRKTVEGMDWDNEATSKLIEEKL